MCVITEFYRSAGLQVLRGEGTGNSGVFVSSLAVPLFNQICTPFLWNIVEGCHRAGVLTFETVWECCTFDISLYLSRAHRVQGNHNKQTAHSHSGLTAFRTAKKSTMSTSGLFWFPPSATVGIQKCRIRLIWNIKIALKCCVFCVLPSCEESGRKWVDFKMSTSFLSWFWRTSTASGCFQLYGSNRFYVKSGSILPFVGSSSEF